MLPHGLWTLIASAALCSIGTAAPTVSHSSVKLTAANFKSQISAGIWLIEFFSPYCHHCKSFAPTWEKLVEEHGPKYQASAGLSFAQVDCIVSGDLCAQQGIKGYPSIFWYDDSLQKDEFKGARTAENLLAFINQRVPQKEDEQQQRDADSDGVVVDPVVPPVVLPDGKASAPADSKNESNAADLTRKKPDDAPPTMPRFKIQARKVPNEEGNVQTLDAAGLAALIDPNAGNGPSFVKFYAPWCSHCKALAPTWKDLAAALKSTVNVAEVNCDEPASKDACRTNRVQFYPTLIFFHEGERVEYSGSRTLTQMTSFAAKAAAVHAVRDISPYELSEVAHSGDTFFLYLYPSTTADEEQKIVSSASRALLGAVTVYKSHSLDLFSKYGLSSAKSHFLTFKGGLTEHPYLMTTYSGSLDRDIIIGHLKKYQLPLFDQMTTENSKAYFENPGAPLIVLAAIGKDEKSTHLRAMREAVENWHAEPFRLNAMGREVLFAWVDAPTWAQWLYNTYKVERGKDLAILIADPKNKTYYNDIEGESVRPAQIVAALKRIANKQMTARSTMNRVQRAAAALEDNSKRMIDWIAIHPYISVIGMLLGAAGFIYMTIYALESSNAPSARFNMNGPKQE